MKPTSDRSLDASLIRSPPTPRKRRRLVEVQPLAAPTKLGMLERLPADILEECVAPLILSQGEGGVFAQASRAARELMVDTASTTLTRQVIRRRTLGTQSLSGGIATPPAAGHSPLLRQAHAFLRRFDHPPYTLDQWAEMQPSDQRTSAALAVAEIKGTRARRAGELNIHNLALGALPDGFAYMAWLTELNLNGNRLEDLPNDLNSLTDLSLLSLKDNRFNAIPSVVFSLGRLEFLDISHNQLSEIPYDLFQLQRLMTLDMSYNAIQTVPSRLGSLSRLENLSLNDNRIQSLPEDIGLLDNLFDFNIANNLLVRLPDQIGNMRLLEEFNLSGNRLVALPATLAECLNLTDLCLHQNRFEEVPEVVVHLMNLMRLSLFDNPLRYHFPVAFHGLTHLHHLHVDSSQWRALTYLPLSLLNVDWVDLNPESEYHRTEINPDHSVPDIARPT